MSNKDKKFKEGEEEQSAINWDGSSYFSTRLMEEMKSMWEIPQIYQFLYLTKDILNVPPITIYEMERMLAIPQASKQLANIMTCLLSNPMGKPKLQKIPPMPYEFWTNILMHKINNWFKFYDGKHGDVIKILETVGIEPEFWNIFPDSSVFADRDFGKLSFKQRVWLLKTICDTLMHTRKTIQEEISNHSWEDQIEINLGTDRNGAKYIYFPQFINSELRVYRYSMNNNVLFSKKPVIPKKTAEGSETKRKVKRKRKSKWQNGLCSKVKKKNTPAKPREKEIDKDFYICNCFDSAINLQIGEDIDLGCTSTSSSNNISNINLENFDGKEINDPLITSEISTMSSDASSISSNKNDDNDDNDDDDNDDDDNNSQLTNSSDEENSFKGFSKSSCENHCIEIINKLLNKLQSEIDDDYMETIKNVIADTRSYDVENIDKQMKNNYESLSNESDPTTVKDCLDNLSNKSKNDDEKLNDTTIENIILDDKMFSTNSEYNNGLDSSSAFRSIDEKLNENETSITNEIESILSDVPDISNNCDMIRSSMRLPNDSEIKDTTGNDNAIDGSFLDTNETHDSVGRSPTMVNKNLKMEDNSLLNDISQIVDDDINRDEVENNPERDNERASFKSMLGELSVSNFQLVADSVETLRDLISSFPSNKPASNCRCEVQLVNKLTELLNTVESIETVLKDTTRKAKAKLLKEWTNFKIGSMGDQDSSGESGVSSNWWIVGSQDYQLPTTSDATLQTLPQSTVSPASTESCPSSPAAAAAAAASAASAAASAAAAASKCVDNEEEEERTSGKEKDDEDEDEGKDKEECKKSENNDEFKRTESNECNKSENNESKGSEGNQRKRSYVENDDEKRNVGEQQQENGENTEGEEREENKDCEQQNRRVLRARGISSYIEQLYPYEEIDENELGEWSDVKTIYAPPSSQTYTSVTYSYTKNKYKYWSEKEDSDQDWILPGSRRRKNKRSSTNKRLRTSQNKTTNKRNNSFENTQKEVAPCNKISNNYPEPPDKSSSTSSLLVYPRIEENSVRTISSMEENTNSVHSELNIKDETPIVTNQCKTNYNVNGGGNGDGGGDGGGGVSYMVQSNPTLIGLTQSHTFVQTNTLIPNIVPPFQQNYYMQEFMPEYVVYNQQSNFIPIQPQQPPVINQVPCIVTSQNIVSHQPIYATERSNLINIVQPDNKANKISQKGTSSSQSNFNVIKQSDIGKQLSITTQPDITKQFSIAKQPDNITKQPNTIKQTNATKQSNVTKQTNIIKQPNVTKQPIITIQSNTAKQSNTVKQYNTLKQSNVTIRPNIQQSNVAKQPSITIKRQVQNKNLPKPKGSKDDLNETNKDTTSLIILSDSDDEVEIINEKPKNECKESSSNDGQLTVSDITNGVLKNIIPQEIIQRIHQGCISITPIKSTPPTKSNNPTQLVVVVNETGNYYALALPNGSKLILTPEQVAQIRASNGGKLVL